MRNLLDFLARYNHCFIFIILEIISFSLLFRFNSYQGSVFFSSANAVVGKIYQWDSAITEFFSMAAANKRLTERNLELERMVSILSEELYKKGSDSSRIKALRAQVPKKYKMIPAQVISSSLNRIDNLMTIDKGLSDGIRPDMGVASGSGIVGVVYISSNNYSVVIPVLNSKSNISVRVKGKGYYGHLNWTGGASNEAFVNDIPRYAKFQVGDTIETSGHSSIFPPGLMVGKILELLDSSDGLSYGVKIELATDFSNLRNVCVIDNSSLDERLRLLRASRDSLKIREE